MSTAPNTALRPQYADLQWRLDAPLATRARPEGHPTPQAPEYTLCLSLVRAQSELAATTEGEGEQAQETQEVEPQEAWLQADYPTLRAMTASLEGALCAMKTPGARRVQRLVK